MNIIVTFKNKNLFSQKKQKWRLKKNTMSKWILKWSDKK